MEIIYEDKIIAFIDVLGFSNLVFADKTEPINEYYSMILNDFKSVVEKHRLCYLLISDSIVIHTSSTKENLYNLIKVLNDLQHRLLLKGILIRGGISFGNLFVDESQNIIVGPGLINAYKLEGLAIYPRIILDRGLINRFFDGSNKSRKELKGLVRFTPPIPYLLDFPYLDYARGVTLDFQPSKFESVIKTLKEHYYVNSHIAKYEWLRSNLLDRTEKALRYFAEKDKELTKNEKKRIRLLTKFKQDLLYI